MGAGSTQENVLTILEALESPEKEGYHPPASGRTAAESLYAHA
jgi:hypothetical protein